MRTKYVPAPTSALTALIAAACLSLATPYTVGASGPGTPLEVEVERDVTISGINNDDRSGFGVATGDINNDGVDDLLIGAEHADPLGRTNAGEAYVVFGPLTTDTVDLAVDAAITIQGVAAFDCLGAGVAIGDLNDDGITDLAIGAWGADPNGTFGAGETYVLFGPLAQGTLDLSTDADLTIIGIDQLDHSGVSLAIGDLDHDGADDLVIGAEYGDPGGKTDAGEAYVLFGPLTRGTLGLSTDADLTINGIDAGDYAGTGVAVGDVNGDGGADIIIGAEHADPGTRLNAGETYVIFGPLAAGELELSVEADITVSGSDPGDRSGRQVAGGDVDNDGADDIVIGAGGADPAARTDAGETYVVLGPRQTGPIELSLDAGVTFNGIGDFDGLGLGVAVGDLNGDGAMDLIIGAWSADPQGATGAGESYVMFGEAPPVAAPVPALSAWGLIGMAGAMAALPLWRSRLPHTPRRRFQTAIMESQRPWSLRSPLPCRPTPPV